MSKQVEKEPLGSNLEMGESACVDRCTSESWWLSAAHSVISESSRFRLKLKFQQEDALTIDPIWVPPFSMIKQKGEGRFVLGAHHSTKVVSKKIVLPSPIS